MTQYRLFCCREGLAAVPSDAVQDVELKLKNQDQPLVFSDGGTILLPRCRAQDHLLLEPPLAETLSETDIAYMTAYPDHRDYPIAATCFGPEGQDKAKNEDFALAATIKTEKGLHAFAAVADGVGTKTFWAERASRLACIAAYKAVLSCVPGWDSLGIDDTVAAKFRNALDRRIRWTLECDQELLLSMPEYKPFDWSDSLYAKYIGDRKYWYNTTLLFSYLGPQKGLICFAGDGGIKIVKNHRNLSNSKNKHDENTLLFSTENIEINSYVSLDGLIYPKIGVINYPQEPEPQTEVYLASDGPDRSLQRVNAESGLLAFHDVQSSNVAAQRLREIWSQQGSESDNYSFALLRWPVQESVSVLPVFTGIQADEMRDPPAKVVLLPAAAIRDVSPAERVADLRLEITEPTAPPLHGPYGPAEPSSPISVSSQEEPIWSRCAASAAYERVAKTGVLSNEISIGNLFRDICIAVDEHCKRTAGPYDDRWCFRLLIIEQIFGFRRFRNREDRIDEEHLSSIEKHLDGVNLLPQDETTLGLVRRLYNDRFNFNIMGWERRGGPSGRAQWNRGRIWEHLQKTSESFRTYANDRARCERDFALWWDSSHRRRLQAQA